MDKTLCSKIQQVQGFVKNQSDIIPKYTITIATGKQNSQSVSHSIIQSINNFLSLNISFFESVSQLVNL